MAGSDTVLLLICAKASVRLAQVLGSAMVTISVSARLMISSNTRPWLNNCKSASNSITGRFALDAVMSEICVPLYSAILARVSSWNHLLVRAQALLSWLARFITMYSGSITPCTGSSNRPTSNPVVSNGTLDSGAVLSNGGNLLKSTNLIDEPTPSTM